MKLLIIACLVALAFGCISWIPRQEPDTFIPATHVTVISVHNGVYTTYEAPVTDSP